VEKRHQPKVLIKKRSDIVSEMDQEINKVTDESVANLHAVYGEACIVQISKRSMRK